jgi:ABC-type branched-subunit amino acid transport system ATPase component
MIACSADGFRGSELSGGEWATARTSRELPCTQGQVMLLDEPTSPWIRGLKQIGSEIEVLSGRPHGYLAGLIA